MVTLVVRVTPPASVTLKLCVPAALVKVPVPVYGGVPAVAVTVTVVVPPLQRMVPALALMDKLVLAG